MARVKLGFTRLSVANKILTARAVVSQMTGNAVYPTPTPPLVDITGATDALELAAQQALKGGTDKTLMKHTIEHQLNQLMGQLQDYVQVASKGEPMAIESSGMEVRNERSPSTLPPVVLNPRATVGSNAGSIQLNWGSAKGAKSYVVEILLPAPKNSEPSVPIEDGDGTAVMTDNTATTEWIRIDTVTRSKLTVKNLITGTVYKFRIAAINTAGQGGYSQTVSSVAP